MITKEAKSKAIKSVQRGTSDVGSPEVQVAVFTDRIKELTEHLKTHKKDNHSRRGLLQLVGKRKKQLNFLKQTNPEKYQELVKKLGLRG
ncbi:TPA: 30S ribosomal protein S15 [Candidatus Saccharibacteria bacterium]|nr:30S ribosomal protein S15 [Candidatus Saccharibacteria bacterium]HIO87744.1 30S ribosomal protein S15 [Candidatus Saccharibacteria bacterium]